jgi:type II secretion system protein G
VKNKKKGFTLIEVLVVVSIIGVLSSTILSSLNTSQARARDARRLQDLKQIGNALNMYYADYGEYPQTNGAYWSSTNLSWDNLENLLVPKYISKLPVDPINDAPYLGTIPSKTATGIYAYWYIIYTPSYNKVEYDLIARAELEEPYACGKKEWYFNTTSSTTPTGPGGGQSLCTRRHFGNPSGSNPIETRLFKNYNTLNR